MKPLTILLLTTTAALAEPPVGADPTLAPWFRGLQQPDTGISCCSVSDCRMVDWRPAGDHYEAYIDAATFGAGAPGWMPVPAAKIVHTTNPTGRAVACWHGGYLYCFVKAVES